MYVVPDTLSRLCGTRPCSPLRYSTVSTYHTSIRTTQLNNGGGQTSKLPPPLAWTPVNALQYTSSGNSSLVPDLAPAHNSTTLENTAIPPTARHAVFSPVFSIDPWLISCSPAGAPVKMSAALNGLFVLNRVKIYLFFSLIATYVCFCESACFQCVTHHPETAWSCPN